jgi:hypothetical protein
MLVVLDDFDDHGQVRRQVHQAGRVDDARRAEARDPVQHGGTGKSLATEPLEERPVQRLVMPLVGIADEDADESSRSVEVTHVLFPSRTHAITVVASR